jgi:hypothetical protein
MKGTAMKRDEIFKSKYLKHADLKGKPAVVTITSATLETLKNGDKEQEKIVLCFKGTPKQLPLNMVNWDSVAEIAGGDTDEWIGARIELYPTNTTMGGKVTPCIRVRPPSSELPLAAKPVTKAAPPPETEASDDLDDQIPF